MSSNLPEFEPGLNPLRSLASTLSPLEATIARDRAGWMLQLTPMRAVEAMSALLDPDGEPADVLLHDVVQEDWRDGATPLPLAAVARRLAIDPCRTLDDDAIVVDERQLPTLLGLLPARRLGAIRVAGPVEPRDARAMLAAHARGGSPLDVELRATAALTARDDRVIELAVPERFDALAVVAEALRRYVGAVLRKPTADVEGPPLWQIERLLAVSGRLAVRPIETESYTTAVDVGISTRPRDEPGPADRSLIYDIFSRTWHDEE